VTFDRSNAPAFAAAGLALLVWSSSYAAIAYGLRVFTPGELSLLRFAIASTCFAVPVALGKIKLPPRRDWPAVIALGLIGNTAYQLFLGYSMTRISAGAAAVVISMAPAVTAALAVLRLKETLSVRAVAGLLVAFAGTLLVTVGRGNAIRFEPMELLVFAAVLCCSIYFVWQKPLFQRTSPLGFTAASMFVGTLGLLPFGAHLPAKLLAVPSAQIYSALYLGFAPTVVGFLAWSFALSRAPASRISSFLYLQPIGAFIIAWLWLGEVPGAATLFGAALVIGGVVLTALPAAHLLRVRGMLHGSQPRARSGIGGWDTFMASAWAARTVFSSIWAAPPRGRRRKVRETHSVVDPACVGEHCDHDGGPVQVQAVPDLE
jgi:drug/metabolite transporter (DMT)-like permease